MADVKISLRGTTLQELSEGIGDGFIPGIVLFHIRQDYHLFIIQGFVT